MRYRVTADVTISMTTVVEAKSKAAAKRKAMEQPMLGLCHQCAGGKDEEEWVTSGEFDGEPRPICIEAEP